MPMPRSFVLQDRALPFRELKDGWNVWEGEWRLTTDSVPVFANTGAIGPWRRRNLANIGVI